MCVCVCLRATLTLTLTLTLTHRCGEGGFKRLKEHAFFASIDWRRLLRRQLTPPFVPDVRDETSQHTSLEDLLGWGEHEDTPIDPQVEALLDQHF